MPTNRALGALALALALTLAACGGDGSDTSSDTTAQSSTTEHNDADVAFATDMIQHHGQALSMVDLTADRPLDPAVQVLADDIRAAQAPEIEQMSGWLQEWGEEVPEAMSDHAGAGHDMGGDAEAMEDMPGMMAAADMAALEDASDAHFQDMWLEMMVEHHEGAVEMAEIQRSEGQYEPAVDLAGAIVTSQTAEIETMQELLS